MSVFVLSFGAESGRVIASRAINPFISACERFESWPQSTVFAAGIAGLVVLVLADLTGRYRRRSR